MLNDVPHADTNGASAPFVNGFGGYSKAETEMSDRLIKMWDALPNDEMPGGKKPLRERIVGPWRGPGADPNFNEKKERRECVEALVAAGWTKDDCLELAECTFVVDGFGASTRRDILIRELFEPKKQPEPDFGETLPFTMFADIKPSLVANDFVEGLLQSASLSVVYGEPGSRKSFWVLDLALHVASGRTYHGRAVEQGAVIYLALEGGAGIRNRIEVARRRMDLPDTTPLILVQCPVDLCRDDADVNKVIATIKLAAHRYALPVRLVVVDTLARALAGGSENGPEDMGALVAKSDSIRHETGACVLYIHHCGKDVAKGMRGHSSLEAATDTAIEMTCGPDTSVARFIRQRDLAGGDLFSFRLEQVELGLNQRGKPVTSCIVEPTETQEAGRTAKGAPLKPETQALLREVNDAIITDGKDQRPTPGMALQRCVTRVQLREQLIANGWLNEGHLPKQGQSRTSGQKKAAFKADRENSKLASSGYNHESNNLISLRNKGFLAFSRDFVWLLHPLSSSVL